MYWLYCFLGMRVVSHASGEAGTTRVVDFGEPPTEARLGDTGDREERVGGGEDGVIGTAYDSNCEATSWVHGDFPSPSMAMVIAEDRWRRQRRRRGRIGTTFRLSGAGETFGWMMGSAKAADR
jgi:hypothetical protein